MCKSQACPSYCAKKQASQVIVQLKQVTSQVIQQFTPVSAFKSVKTAKHTLTFILMHTVAACAQIIINLTANGISYRMLICPYQPGVGNLYHNGFKLIWTNFPQKKTLWEPFHPFWNLKWINATNNFFFFFWFLFSLSLWYVLTRSWHLYYQKNHYITLTRNRGHLEGDRDLKSTGFLKKLIFFFIGVSSRTMLMCIFHPFSRPT